MTGEGILILLQSISLKNIPFMSLKGNFRQQASSPWSKASTTTAIPVAGVGRRYGPMVLSLLTMAPHTHTHTYIYSLFLSFVHLYMRHLHHAPSSGRTTFTYAPLRENQVKVATDRNFTIMGAGAGRWRGGR